MDITYVSSIEVTKANIQTMLILVGLGDIINYTITIENTGNTDVISLTDVLTEEMEMCYYCHDRDSTMQASDLQMEIFEKAKQRLIWQMSLANTLERSSTLFQQ